MAYKYASDVLSQWLEEGKSKLKPSEVLSLVNDIRVETLASDYQALPEVFARLRSVALDSNPGIACFGTKNLIQSIEHAMR